MSLVVFGFGNVGKKLCEQALSIGMKIICVIDSSAAVISKNSIDINKIHALNKFKENNRLLKWDNNDDKVVPITNLLSINWPSNTMIADCSASDDTIKYLIKFQKENIPIALANKKPLTNDYLYFKELTNNRQLIRIESTVCAGLPVINAIQRIQDSGDNIIKIEGQFSGTLGYILSSMQNGDKFSDSVKKAKELGYTEPDPRDDLSGKDVARKALIIGRLMGMKLELNDIDIEALYSKDMMDLSVKEFMDEIPKMDNKMDNKIKNAIHNGNRLRYTASVVPKNNEIKVGLTEVNQLNPLYNLTGTNNLCSMETEWYNLGNELVISGPGAGVNVTAAGVLSDIMDMAMKLQLGKL
mmetsp:Transcript_101452/g.124204  ORF Transcript_101452/g.124204 Transcript_101452/m.124204 type:complete len:355 (-) Transcript_101452:7-1071(-)